MCQVKLWMGPQEQKMQAVGSGREDGVCVCVSVSVSETERKRERGGGRCFHFAIPV